MELSGLSFISGNRSSYGGATFSGRNAASGAQLQPAYVSATPEELNAAAAAATAAFNVYSRTTATARAAFLHAIATGLEGVAAELVIRAMLQCALHEPRPEGEAGRTCGQLRLFASVIEDGSCNRPHRYCTARPQVAAPAWPALILCPLGPVAVFGVSNLPPAFSTAGGDTASALAGGNPVIVKTHSAHPGTSEIVSAVISTAVAHCGLLGGVFSMP